MKKIISSRVLLAAVLGVMMSGYANTEKPSEENVTHNTKSETSFTESVGSFISLVGNKGKELWQTTKPYRDSAKEKTAAGIEVAVESGAKVFEAAKGKVKGLTKETSVVENTAKKNIANAKVDAKEVKFAFLNKENAKRFGVGAIALISIGGVSFVLYKNGVFKKIVDGIATHPKKAASIALVAGAIGGFALAHHYGWIKKTPFDKALDFVSEAFSRGLSRVKSVFNRKVKVA